MAFFCISQCITGVCLFFRQNPNSSQHFFRVKFRNLTPHLVISSQIYAKHNAMGYLKVYYFIRRKKNNQEKVPIYCRLQMNGKRKDFSIFKWIEMEKWDDKKQYPKTSYPELKRLYDYMKSIEHSLYDSELQCLKYKAGYSVHDIFNYHRGIDTNYIGVVELFNYHQKQFKELVQVNQRAPRSMEKFDSCFRYVLKFVKHKYNCEDYDVRKINYDFIIELDHFLRINGLSNNTAVKYMQSFKKIIKIALAKGYILINPFAEYRFKLETVEREFLTDDEIYRIQNLKLNKRLSENRDAFIIACYTGLAYVDLKRMKQDNIYFDNGELWIKIYRQKSKVRSSIMLLEPAKRIIEKYKDDPRVELGQMVIPMLSNQKVNRHLKSIAKAAGIKKTLTFHIARHTFATTITLAKGVSLEVVSKMLGHKSVKHTQHYAKLVNTRVQDEMQALKSIYR